MKLSDAKHIHFSGIKGVGMTALALYIRDMGIEVSGSDVKEEFVTDEVLNKHKISVSEGFSNTNIPKNAQVLIYSAAHLHNPQVKYAKKTGLKSLNYAQALGELVNRKSMIAVCGVGGKTTTTAMIATILEKAQLNPSFVNGVGNIDNLGVPGRHTNGKYVVVEADDYAAAPEVDNTPKFLYLRPQVIVVTNIEYDHPDVYKNLQATKAAFKSFFSLLPKYGYLIANVDNPNIQQVLSRLKKTRGDIKIITYGFSPQAQWRITKALIRGQLHHCEINFEGISMELKLKIPGKFNAANACAAVAAVTQLGVSQIISAEALNEFSGTKRRFEKIGTFNGIEVWDDYAHHPKEISATLEAVREWFKNKRIIAVFQPHTYSRTKALFKEFARSLSLADEAIITEIYGSKREKKDPTISGKMLAQKTKDYSSKVRFIKSQDILSYLKENTENGDLIISMGAGDIYKVVRRLVEAY